MIEKLRDEEGMSLIELVITLMIMSIAYLAILGGMTTAITLSTLHRVQATGETVLRSYAEAVKALEYRPCTDPALGGQDPDYSAPDFVLGGGFERVPDPPNNPNNPNVKYWHPTRVNSPIGEFNDTCTIPDEGVQEVTLVIRSTSATNPVEIQLHLVKRFQVLCPPPPETCDPEEVDSP